MWPRLRERGTMPRIIAFNNVTLDGFFAGESGDISWAKGHMDDEFTAFVAANAVAGGQLLFGRITYELMASYWPTAFAAEHDPQVAERMNSLAKVVFSRTLREAAWKNTELVSGDLVESVRQMKSAAGPDMAILGSGSVVAQLAQAGLIDEYQFVVNPVIIGKGRTMFQSTGFEATGGFAGVSRVIDLKLMKTRSFANGNVVLWYQPASGAGSAGRPGNGTSRISRRAPQ